MLPTLKYLWLTCKHKAFVFKAGLRTGAPIWRLIIHDWTKFTPAEAPHYGRQFFGDQSDPEGFSLAWLHHQRNNPHHWEYWVPVTGHNRGGYGDLQPLPMPDWAMREMVADWMGAGRAYEGKWPDQGWPWLVQNWPKIAPWIHPKTQHDICVLVNRLTGTKIGTMPLHPYGPQDMDEAQIRADEREKIARDLECEADLLPCAEDAAVTRANAALIRAKMSYAVAFDGEIADNQ